MNRQGRVGRLGTSVLAVALLLAACGRKTAPLTPPSPRPAKVHITSAIARDDRAFLTWSFPSKNVEGTDMPPAQLKRFLVYRAEIEQEKRRARYRHIATIETEQPGDAEISGGSVRWQDEELVYGRVYAYRVRAESDRGWLSPVSDEVRIAPLQTVATPGRLTAAAGDGSVKLAWAAVTTKTDGSRHEGFIGYNVYRGDASRRYGGRPLNQEPLRKPAYQDRSVENGKTYYYMVRAVDSPVLPWRESLDSDEVTAAPVDLTPPARPSGLTVVPGVSRVFLTWNENAEADVAGYHVYRTPGGGKPFERITDKPLMRTTYSDDTVKAGVVHTYSVSAVDAAGNESVRSKELSAAAERRR